MRREPDNRFWILDPSGHRRVENGRKDQYRDGDMVDTVFGEAVLIIPPAPPAEDWYCDICSEIILTKWGREPFPVPMMGGYALCLEHFNKTIESPIYDMDTDEVIPGSRMGEWPMRGCSCPACVNAASIVLTLTA